MSYTFATNKRSPAMQAALYHARTKNLAAKKSVAVADLSANAYGSITFAANPLTNATITLGGTVITFGTTVAIGANLAATLTTLLAFVNASADANLLKCAYAVVGSALTIKSKTPGTSAFTLAASVATVSHSPLVSPTIHKRAKL